MIKLTLPANSEIRKEIPLYSGCYSYFPAALAGVAMHSKISNEKHNPGEPLHHARGKSMDHADCISRHLMDLADMQARRMVWTADEEEALLAEANALCWRALALSQELHEKFGAPLAPAARKPTPKPLTFHDFPYAGGDGISTALTETYYKTADDGRKYHPDIEKAVRQARAEINLAYGQAQTAARSGLSGSGSTLPQCGQIPVQDRACGQTLQTQYGSGVAGYAGDPPGNAPDR